MIYFSFLKTIILLVPIFKPIFDLFYILKTNMVKNPQMTLLKKTKNGQVPTRVTINKIFI